MKCITCGEGRVKRGLTEISDKVKGETFSVTMLASKCGKCGNVSIEGKEAQELMRLLADEYRSAHSLLTSKEIKLIRGDLNQQQFALALGVGVASVKRWELGGIQDAKSDRLLREYARFSIARRDNYHWCCTNETIFVQHIDVASENGMFAYAA